MKDINFIDLGVHTGEEIDIVLNDYKNYINKFNLNIYGIEADPYWAEQLEYRYEDFSNIKIHNIAACEKSSPVKLYLDPNRLGSSLYSSKSNVSDNYVVIPGLPISKFIIKYISNFNNSINVLKLNIEGAEMVVYEDLIKNDMLKNINLFCGHHGHDILKVPELSNQVDKYFSLMKNNNIELKYLCGEVHPERSINIFNEVMN